MNGRLLDVSHFDVIDTVCTHVGVYNGPMHNTTDVAVNMYTERTNSKQQPVYICLQKAPHSTPFVLSGAVIDLCKSAQKRLFSRTFYGCPTDVCGI